MFLLFREAAGNLQRVCDDGKARGRWDGRGMLPQHQNGGFIGCAGQILLQIPYCGKELLQTRSKRHPRCINVECSESVLQPLRRESDVPVRRAHRDESA